MMPSIVRLTQKDGSVSNGSSNGIVTLVKDQQMCVNTTAILEVSVYRKCSYNTNLLIV